MGKITGFKEFKREMPEDRPVTERVQDWKDVHKRFPEEQLKIQASRCMDCGIPFCHKGCPLGNIIPDWNDLIYRNDWKEALERLHSTNNFPEFTGRICPAPCEDSCVLNINDRPVTIERIELGIVEHGYEAGWIMPTPPKKRTGKTVAIVGSGPSGLACADQLNKAGHAVTVFERNDRVGGLLTYGIPDFKLEKWVVQRRVQKMQAEGVTFKTNAHVGVNVSVEEIKKNFDAIVLAGGATHARDLNVPGRDLKGVHFAMEYLPLQNKRNQGDAIPEERLISAKDKHVIVLGGGDTGSDCHGTALRQGAKSVTSIELLPKPPLQRNPNNPWPEWGRILRTSSSHEEGGDRDWSVSTKKFSGEGRIVNKIHLVRLEWKENLNGGPPEMKEIPGSEFELPADLVLLALGFLGPEKETMLKQWGITLTPRGSVQSNKDYMTNVPGIFSCGDMRRGQSLVVWAIWEGRESARGVDQYLMGATSLPSSPFHF
ncbi:MAG: glutamate synthase subunit beta [Elusimicrobia bacterium]|nr:glutamate synthase subunit beta [Elusimicrobiota bacterium]